MLLVVALLFLSSLHFLFARSHPRGFPPGPRLPLPVVGDHRRLREPAAATAERLRKIYGNVVGYWDVRGRRGVLVADVELFQEFNAKNEFSGRAVPGYHFTQRLSDGSVPGIALAEGKSWREQRQFTLHTLRNLGFGKLSTEDGIAREVADLCDSLELLEGASVDMRNEFNLSVLGVLWNMVTSEQLPRNSEKLKSIIKALDAMMSTPPTPLTDILFSSKVFTWVMKHMARLSSVRILDALGRFCDESIQRHREMFDANNEPSDFVDHYLAKIEHDTSSSAAFEEDDKEQSSFAGPDGYLNLNKVTKELFLAGTHTTSTALLWSLLCMVMNPEVQAKVREELDRVTGRTRLPVLNDRPSTPYTEAVLHEVLRLGNILPKTVGQRALADGVVRDKDGKEEYYVPKGADIKWNLGAVLKDPRYFPKPDSFDPTRYLSEDGQIFAPHPKMIAFGYGKRRCLGEPLARMEMYLFFTSLVTRFEIRNSPENGELTLDPQMGITNSPRPFKVRFIKRT